MVAIIILTALLSFQFVSAIERDCMGLGLMFGVEIILFAYIASSLVALSSSIQTMLFLTSILLLMKLLNQLSQRGYRLSKLIRSGKNGAKKLIKIAY